MSDKKEAALKAIALVNKGMLRDKACEKANIATSTYAKYRKIANKPNKVFSSFDAPMTEAKKLKAKGMSYLDMSKILKMPMGEVFKAITGKDIIEETEKLSEQKGIPRKDVCEKFLKVPFSAYTSIKYREAQKHYGAKNKNRAQQQKPKTRAVVVGKPFDLVVPHSPMEQMKKKTTDKVIVLVCTADNLSSVLKELE